VHLTSKILSSNKTLHLTISTDYLAPGCPWAGWSPGTLEFCEKRLCHWVVEPSNTWSNLAYLVVGAYLFVTSREQKSVPLFMIALTSFLVGIGSFWFHMSGTFAGEAADVSAMFLISGLMIALNARRLYDLSADTAVRLYVGLCTTSILLLFIFRVVGIPLFAAQIIFAGALEVRAWRRDKKPRDARFLFLLCGSFALAFLLWALDVTKVMCHPDNHLLTGHAAWHLLNAGCLYFYYRYQEQFVRAAG
jgi:hypothetical protein